MSLGQETETDKLWGEGWVLKRAGAWPSACSPRRMARRPGCTLGTHRPGPGRPRATVKALPPVAWPPGQADNARMRRGHRTGSSKRGEGVLSGEGTW